MARYGCCCLWTSDHLFKWFKSTCASIWYCLNVGQCFVYSFSIFWVKKVNAKIQPMAQATGSILVSSILASCLIPFIWQYAPTHLPQAKSLFALIYTVLMASLVAMFCYFKLVQNIKPTTLSLTTVITPMLAMIIGAVLNHEQLSIMVLWELSLSYLVYFYIFIKTFKQIVILLNILSLSRRR